MLLAPCAKMQRRKSYGFSIPVRAIFDRKLKNRVMAGWFSAE